MIEHTDDPLIFNTVVNNAKYAVSGANERHCPFCDREQLTNILATDGDRMWLLNKYPTIEESLMTVLIESDEHLGDVSSNSVSRNRTIFQFAFDCWEKVLDDGKYQSVLMFKNFGPRSGGTLRHPHMQIIGLEKVNGYEHISAENFTGVDVLSDDKRLITISEKPVMGFIEMNAIIDKPQNVAALADSVGAITHYLINDFMGGRCSSYNLFFYRLEGQYICKVVPRFITSPYFIGYKLPQVQNRERVLEVAEELRETCKLKML